MLSLLVTFAVAEGSHVSTAFSTSRRSCATSPGSSSPVSAPQREQKIREELISSRSVSRIHLPWRGCGKVGRLKGAGFEPAALLSRAGYFRHVYAWVIANPFHARECEVWYHDLYNEQFDPVQPTGEAGNRSSSSELVERHCRQLADADLILIFHPNWWGQPPAILKGWIDRVFRPGVAYDYPPDVGPEGAPIGLLRAACGLVFNTSNTAWEREVAVFGNRFRDYGDSRLWFVRRSRFRATCVRANGVEHA
jgi:putative NADPH-quinone reductase